ncbi:hypothetical protein PIB30_006512 [Stylosanthes scabra]|uniref:Uncharacterized protein n=1 Tax=Stylosanthes scabra TaxID=79078 RepID=A0ABU6W2C9_9FABA|nr:hypothetical protein [Stylosanthes scabra]
MLEGYGRRRGASRAGKGGRGCVDGGDTTPTQQTQGDASTSQAVEAVGMSTQSDIPSTPQTQGIAIPSSMSSPLQQAFLDGLSNPGFQQMISDIMLEGDGSYRPDTQFDGSQVHLDLNEPVSGPSHVFMALGGTPPSAAHVPGGSWEVLFMEPTHLPTPERLDEPPARGRARRAPRRRGCGTGGHM